MGLQQPSQNYDSDSGDLSTIDSLTERGQHELDKVILPEQREELFARIQAFVIVNPKLSAFIATNLALSGIPLVTFIVFTLSTGFFSVAVALLLALGGALVFTLSCAGLALLFVVPALFFTTWTACFLFCCGIVGYHLLQWASGSRDQGSARSGSYGQGYNATSNWSKEFNAREIANATT